MPVQSRSDAWGQQGHRELAGCKPDRREALAEDVLLHGGIRELDAPFAVCAPHADSAAAHALQHDSWGAVFDGHSRPAALEPAGQAVAEE